MLISEWFVKSRSGNKPKETGALVADLVSQGAAISKSPYLFAAVRKPPFLEDATRRVFRRRRRRSILARQD
jgi:hypothetical protein